MVESQEIELAGHIIDSGIMTQLFDKVMDMGGNFESLFSLSGKRRRIPVMSDYVLRLPTKKNCN